MTTTPDLLGAVAGLDREGLPTTGPAVALALGEHMRTVQSALSLAVGRGLLTAGGSGPSSSGYRLTADGRRELLTSQIVEALGEMSIGDLTRLHASLIPRSAK